MSVLTSALARRRGRVARSQWRTVAPTYSISGTTRDGSGTPLPFCEVRLFKQGGSPFGQLPFGTAVFGSSDIDWDATNSDANGNYSFVVHDQDFYIVVAYLAGSPDVAGVTLDTIQGT